MSILDNTGIGENETIQRTDFEVWETIENLKLDKDDDELKTIIKRFMWISASAEGILKTAWDTNKDYYRWVDLRTDDIVDWKSTVTDNRIFTDMETIIPLVTATPAKPVVTIPSWQWKNKWQKKAIRDQRIKTQKILLSVYQKQWIQQEYEKMIRQGNIWRIGMIKYGIKDDEIFAKAVLPSRLLLDSEATSIDDSEFVWEKIVTTADKLSKMYPKSKEEIMSKVQNKGGTKITYIEWWTDEMKVVSVNDSIILEAIKNPLFDYSDTPTEEIDEMGKKIKWKPTNKNLFLRPRKPYIRYTVYNIWENIIDDTTALILCKSLQDNINDRKRQIADNAEVSWWPIRVYKWMTSDQSNDADNNLKAGDWVNLWTDQEIWYIQAQPISNFVQNDLQDSRNSIDNIFGIHSTSRWERQAGANESWVARESLKSSDEDRQATIGRALERVSEELYNAFAHLIKVFYDKSQILPVLWEEESWEYVEFKRDDIAEGMIITVKPWSTVPVDPNALRAQALELLWAWRITTRRAYEMMWIEDAEEAAKELELEAVKAQQEQQKILQEEESAKANGEAKTGFEEQIAQMWAWQPQ